MQADSFVAIHLQETLLNISIACQIERKTCGSN